MASARKKTWKVSIFLAKPHITKREQCVADHTRVSKQSVRLSGGPTATLYYKRTNYAEPSWAGFFEGLIDASRMRTSSVSAALILRRKKKWFAVTFGYGRHLLAPTAFEEDFGLKATLNCVEADSIRSVDKATIDAQGRHGREQSSRPATINDFGLDIEQDILRAVSGKPTITEFGTSISGRDALVVRPSVGVRGIADILDLTLRQFRKSAYKKDYPWVDQIQEVRARAVIDDLNEDLVERLINNSLDKVWMAVPEVVEWESISGFQFSSSQSADQYDDIRLPTFLGHLRSLDTLNVDRLKHKRVIAVDSGSGGQKYTWPAFRCLYCETQRGDDVFILNNGKWYAVERSFLQTVNRSIGQIPESTGLRLPLYDDESETKYNARVAKGSPKRFALMDCKNIPYGGGGSRIEFCDLYEKKRLIHVKRYGGSSVLSHLFQQGLVSATLFRAEPEFRRLVNAKLPNQHRFPDVSKHPRASDHEIAFAIISSSKKPLNLPFFSRVSLRTVYRQLRAYGYQVTLTKVSERS